MSAQGTKTERNKEIVRLHLEEGVGFVNLGKRFGITHQRVEQIVRRAGVKVDESRLATGRGAKTVWKCENCGKEDLRPPSGQRYPFCSRSCAAEAGAVGRPVEYTDDDLLAHLRKLARDLGHTPDTHEIRNVSGPAAKLYQIRFGSLANAQALAGLSPNGSGVPGHKSNRLQRRQSRPKPLPESVRQEGTRITFLHPPE